MIPPPLSLVRGKDRCAFLRILSAGHDVGITRASCLSSECSEARGRFSEPPVRAEWTLNFALAGKRPRESDGHHRRIIPLHSPPVDFRSSPSFRHRVGLLPEDFPSHFLKVFPLYYTGTNSPSCSGSRIVHEYSFLLCFRAFTILLESPLTDP